MDPKSRQEDLPWEMQDMSFLPQVILVLPCVALASHEEAV